MVSFNDRPTIHFIPFYRTSICDCLFWRAEDLAEFRLDALLEKAGVPDDMIRAAEEQREISERRVRNQLPSYKIRGYNRPTEWLPLQSRSGKIGYATHIKRVVDIC